MDILVRLDEIVNVVCVCVINRIPRNHGPEMEFSTLKSYLLLQKCLNKKSNATDLF